MRISTTISTVIAFGVIVVGCSQRLDSGPGATKEDTDTIQAGDVQIPPDVDVSLHGVPLEEIYFDTFDGGSVTLAESTAELRARLLDAIPPIDDPVYGDRGEGDWLDDDDLVLGYVSDGQAYAYPFKILNFHEIVNDEINGVPVLISYCPLCRSGIVYDRRVDDDVLSFGNTSALYESDLVMVDRTTGSYWYQVAGRAIVGPLTGTELKLLPSIVSTWGQWTEDHIETLVLTRETGFDRPYHLDSFASYAAAVDAGRFAFPVGDDARDARLSPAELVVGVSLNGESRAYPIEQLSGPINDVVGGRTVVVFPVSGGAAVFDATVDGTVLMFSSTGSQITDDGAGSTWTTEGSAIAGRLAGKSLNPVPARTTFWFAFVGAFPQVEVYSGP